MFKVPEKFRIKHGFMGSDTTNGNNGAFEIIVKTHVKQKFFAIASDGLGWEHVSVSREDRCPTWEEMCAIKDLFWDKTDCVVQYHPPDNEYVNDHKYCLHLWRCKTKEFPIPDQLLV